MKKFVVAVAAGLCLIAAGCGGTQSASQNAIVKQDTAKADAIVKRCLTNPTTLRTRAGRQAFVSCAVPPRKQKQFTLCIEKAALSGVPTKHRLEQAGQTCITRYA